MRVGRLCFFVLMRYAHGKDSDDRIWYWPTLIIQQGPWNELHWLPIQQRIVYKMAVLTRKARATGVPAYLNHHLTLPVATQRTRSAALPLLNLPSLSTDFARRSFSYAAPKIWNSLPIEISSCNSEATFQKHLKTHLHKNCFYTV